MKQFFIFSLICLTSCTNAYGGEQYLDQPASAGNSVPSPNYEVTQPVVQEIPRYKAKLPSRVTVGKSIKTKNGAFIVSGSNREQLTGVGKAAASKIVSDFQQQYQKVGTPEIAIFFNRILSGEVRQWRTSERMKSSGDGAIETNQQQGLFAGSSLKGSGNATLQKQTYIEEEKRKALPEDYLWAYEDGFMKSFLDAGAYLLDRASIMRLNALYNGQGSESKPLSVKKVEMESLLDKADILIELLISNDSTNPYGYEFKAVAKEIQSGRILANSTSLNWDWGSTKSKVATTGTNGYDLKDVVVVPPVTEVSADLAVSMMKDLTRVWKTSNVAYSKINKPVVKEKAEWKKGKITEEGGGLKFVAGDTKLPEISNSSLNFHGLEIYGKYYALLIGVADYQQMTPLKTVINDVEDVAKVLNEKYGYRTQVLKNPGRDEIITSLAGYRKKLTASDNFLIYYAGHGWLDPDTKVGYWLPVDSSLDSPAKWISNATITDSIKALKAKHIMVIADSCYSGTLTRSIVPTLSKNYDSKDYWNKLSKQKARVVLTSGGNEPVSDGGSINDFKHSVFASALLSQLRDNDKIIDGAGLYKKLSPKVLLNSNQTPKYSDLRMAGHEGGDFIFFKSQQEK